MRRERESQREFGDKQMMRERASKKKERQADRQTETEIQRERARETERFHGELQSPLT